MNWRVLTTVALLLGACDTSEGGDSAAPQKCQLLASHFCTRVSNCQLDTFSSCTSQVEGPSVLDCPRAFDVGASFDTCVSQIDALPCNQLTALPASCAGVITRKK